MDIKLLGSACATSDIYFDIVKNTADELNLEYTIEKIEDQKSMDKYGVSIGCLFGYCPGCNFVNEGSTGGKYTPALVINEEVKIHSCFPKIEEIKQVLSETAKK